MSSITAILEKKKSEIKAPKLAPQGHYRFKVVKPHEIKESGDGAWAVVEFLCQAQAEQVDVSEGEMAEYARSVETIFIRHSFIFNNTEAEEAAANNENTAYRMQQFLNQLDLGTDDDATQAEQLAQVQGAEFVGRVIHRPDKKEVDDEGNPIMRTHMGATLALAKLPDYQ